MRIPIVLVTLLLVVAAVGAAVPIAVAQEPARVVLALERARASQERQTSLVRAGAADAARDLGLELDVRALRGTREARIALLDDIVSEGPDGILVVSEDPATLAGPVRAASEAGIGVVLAWGGIDVWRDIGALAFVGADERRGAELAGMRLAELGAARALCVVDIVGDARLDDRCATAASAFAAEGGRMSVLRALDPPGDPTGVRDAIEARLFAEPDIDAVLATEDDSIRWALRALARTDRANRVTLAAYDPDPAALRALADDRIAFAVANQPELQGYIAVVILSAWHDRGLLDGGGGPILTGPRILTPEDAVRVLRSADR